MANIQLEETEWFLQKRQGLVVYLYYNRDSKKAKKYGDILYHSTRLRYLILYVNQESATEIIEELSALKWVKKVTSSAYDEIREDFVGSLQRSEEKS